MFLGVKILRFKGVIFELFTFGFQCNINIHKYVSLLFILMVFFFIKSDRLFEVKVRANVIGTLKTPFKVNIL